MQTTERAGCEAFGYATKCGHAPPDCVAPSLGRRDGTCVYAKQAQGAS